MRFKEIVSRLTGFNVPVFGVSWQPPEPEVAVARRVLAFLEDRRVLFNAYHLEVTDHCIDSVIEIRQFLTTEIGDLDSGSELAKHLRGIRAACRQFFDEMPSGRGRILRLYAGGPFESEFFTQLGELRAAIGHRVAAIAVSHGLDVEAGLASILPEDDTA